MVNDRPIEDPKLQKALEEVKQVMARYGLAGTCMLVAEEEAAFFYHMHAPWSALRYDPGTPFGFRFRANSSETGNVEAHRRVTGAMHTICQLSDFGERTTAWMEDMKLMLRRAGIDFDHTPFAGKPLQRLSPLPEVSPMFVVNEADAAAIRAAYTEGGPLSGAAELRRLFPGIQDNARECAATIAGWQALPEPAPKRAARRPAG